MSLPSCPKFVYHLRCNKLTDEKKLATPNNKLVEVVCPALNKNWLHLVTRELIYSRIRISKIDFDSLGLHRQHDATKYWKLPFTIIYVLLYIYNIEKQGLLFAYP